MGHWDYYQNVVIQYIIAIVRGGNQGFDKIEHNNFFEEDAKCCGKRDTILF